MIIKTHHVEDIPRSLIRKLQEQQKSGDLCDYELKTDSGVNFKVHKWVLSSISPFFIALFNKKNFDKKKNSNSLLVHHVSEIVLEKVIEFIYTGVVELSSDICKDIISVALFFELNTLVNFCIEILIETLNDENCLEMLKFSETCKDHGKKLTEESLKLVCKKFIDFVESPDFLAVSPVTMKILVNQDRISYSENDLYLAVVEWISFDKVNRKNFINELFGKIRFKDLGNDFSKSLIEGLSYNDNFINYLSDIKTTLRELKPESGQQNLFVFTNTMMLSYDTSNNEFSKNITKMKEEREGFGCTIFGKNKVFICGGGGYVGDDLVNTCKYFCMQDSSWHDLPSMKTARWSPSSIAIDDNIYVCGGFSSNYELSSIVELFDINKSVWYEKCSLKMFQKTHNLHSTCHLNKCIYFIHQNCVQRLDSRVKQWEILCDQKTNINVKSVEAYDNYIYGFRENSISIFDIRTNKWIQSKMKYKQHYDYLPRTCVMNNRIYVLGRTKQEDKTIYCLQSFLPYDLSFIDSHILDYKFTYPEAFFSI